MFWVIVVISEVIEVITGFRMTSSWKVNLMILACEFLSSYSSNILQKPSHQRPNFYDETRMFLLNLSS